MKKLPLELSNSLKNYCIDRVSTSYLQDVITDYMEKKNLTNETAKIRMIMNDLRIMKRLFQNGKQEQAKAQYNFVKNTLLTIK